MTSSRYELPDHPSPLFARKQELEASGERIRDLVVLNPTLVGIHYPEPALREIIAASTSIRYEPEPLGSLPARAAVAADFARRGAPIPPDRICLTASTSDALSLLFKLLTDPGESVLVPRPGYPLLDDLAPLDGLAVEPYAVDETGGWEFPAPPPRCAAVLAMAPHMPTGAWPTRDSLEALSGFCMSNRIALIIDEVFADYATESLGPAAELAPLVFRLGGLSKTAGLPGFKLGWIGVEGERDAVAEMMRRLEHIADAYLSVNSIVMNALPALLKLAPEIRINIAERVRGNLQELQSSRLAPKLRSTGATWTAAIEVADDEKAAQDLLKKGWWVHPGYFYDFSAPRIVVSLLTELKVFAAFLHSDIS